MTQKVKRTADQKAQAQSYMRYMVWCMGKSLSARSKYGAKRYREAADTNFRRSTNPSYGRNAIYLKREIAWIRNTNYTWHRLLEVTFPDIWDPPAR